MVSLLITSFIVFSYRLENHRVEKYRPNDLNDVVSHKDITSTSECLAFVCSHSFPHDDIPQSKTLSPKTACRTYFSMDLQAQERRLRYLQWREGFMGRITTVKLWRSALTIKWVMSSSCGIAAECLRRPRYRCCS